jgi:hypothetical protein
MSTTTRFKSSCLGFEHGGGSRALRRQYPRPRRRTLRQAAPTTQGARGDLQQIHMTTRAELS